MNLWGPHAMKHTEGAKVIDELKPSDTDYIITIERIAHLTEQDWIKPLKEFIMARVLIR